MQNKIRNTLVITLFLTMLSGCLSKNVSLKVTSNIEGSSVFIDGSLKGKTPLEIKVSEGEHELKVKYLEQVVEKQVNLLSSGDVNEFAEHFDLRLLVTLNIISDVIGADVFVDDEKVGVTPFNDKFLEGNYELRVAAYKEQVSKSVALDANGAALTSTSQYFNFKNNISIEGAKVAWIEKTKYKVPVETGGGLFGFLVSSVTKGGLTESFETIWSGTVISDDGQFSIEIDSVEIGRGKFSYKGREYRVNKEQEVLGMVGSTTDKNFGEVEIKTLNKLAAELASSGGQNMDGRDIYQAAQVLKILGKKYLSRNSSSYNEIMETADRYIAKYKNS